MGKIVGSGSQKPSGPLGPQEKWLCNLALPVTDMLAYAIVRRTDSNHSMHDGFWSRPVKKSKLDWVGPTFNLSVHRVRP